MNVLSFGPMFGQSLRIGKLFKSQRGHELRTTACAGTIGEGEDPDYLYQPDEDAPTIIDRIRRDWSPDLLLYWLPDLVPPPYKTEELSIPTVAVLSDWTLRYPGLALNLARFDRVFVDKKGSEWLQLVGAVPEYRFPIYSHLSTLHRRHEIPRDIDVVFVGSLNRAIHAARCAILERVAQAATMSRFEIWDGVFGEEYTRILNRARIVLNYTLRGEMNLRCYEAAACGALLFVEESNREIRDWFEPGREVILYRKDNVVDLLQQHLSDEACRTRRALAGNEKATVLVGERRLDAIIEELSKTEVKNRAYHGFTSEQQLLADATLQGFDIDSPVGVASQGFLLRMAEKHPKSAVFPAVLGFRFFLQAKRTGAASPNEVLSRALFWAREACRRDPECTILLFNLAEICRCMGFNDQAEGLFRHICATDALSNDLLLYGEMTDPLYVRWLEKRAMGKAEATWLHAMSFIRQARLALNRGDLESARTAAECSQRITGETVEGLRLLGELLLKQGEVENAVFVLEKALPLSPFDHELRFLMIRLYAVLGKQRKARAFAAESARIFSVLPQLSGVAESFLELCA